MPDIGDLKVKITADTSGLESGLSTAEQKVGGFSGALGKVGGAVGKMGLAAAAGGVAALAGGLIGGVAAGMKFNSSVEQTTIAMGTMLGSTDKAKTLIGDVTKMAAATPFEFPELADATKRLVAYGVSAEEAVPLMTRLGDVSSALGIPLGEMSDLYGKMKVSGKITMEDMNQMAGRGIPIYGELAKQLGVGEGEIRGLVESGKIGFPQVEQAIEGMTSKGGMFAGMMDAQSRSFEGLWGTLKDGVTQVFATAITPLFDWLVTSVLPTAIEMVDRFTAGFAEGGLLGGIKALFGGMGESVGGFMSFMKGVFEEVGPVIAGVWNTIVFLAQEAWAVIQPIIATIAEWIRAHWDEISAVTSTIWETIKLVISTALELIKVVVSTVLDAIRAFWEAHGDEIMAVVTVIWDLIKGTIETVMGVIQGLMKTIMALIHGDWQGAWDAIKSIGQTIWDGIKSAASTTFNAMKSALSGVWDEIKSAFQSLWDGCKSAWDSAASWIGDIPGKIKGFFSGAASWLTDIGRSIMDGLLSGIKSAWNSVANFLSGLGAKIKSLKGPIEDDRKLLIPEGKAIMDGLGIGLDNGWNAIEAKLAKYGKDIKAWGSSLHSVQDVVLGTTGGSIAAPFSSVVGKIGISNNGAAPEDTRFAEWGKFTGDIDKLVANGGEYVRGSGQLPSMVYDGRGHWLTTTNQPGQPSATVSPTTGADSRVININVSGASGIDVGRQIANVLATV
jgi:tape measure domain-containing protein